MVLDVKLPFRTSLDMPPFPNKGTIYNTVRLFLIMSVELLPPG